MLSSVYRDAIKNRTKTLSVLHNSSCEAITREAGNRWSEYEPKKTDSDIVGIDSSYNSVKYQGLELWVATAVAVRADNSVCGERHKSGLGRVEGGLGIMASRMETALCGDSAGGAELVLMDGSAHSKVIDGTYAKNSPVPTYRGSGVVFVSKTSDTRDEFSHLGSEAGDIFYYGRASGRPGFSRIRTDVRYGAGLEITSSFLRLSESQPLLRVDVFGGGLEMKSLADRLYKNSVAGYPYALRLAHKNCKVGGSDMRRFASLHGMANQTGSREVLD